MAPGDAGAVALEPTRGTVPMTMVPFRNCTVPVGVPVPGGAVTVAIHVAAELASVVVVPALLMVTGSALDRADVKRESPPYWAVMLCGPPAREDVENEAVP